MHVLLTPWSSPHITMEWADLPLVGLPQTGKVSRLLNGTGQKVGHAGGEGDPRGPSQEMKFSLT